MAKLATRAVVIRRFMEFPFVDVGQAYPARGGAKRERTRDGMHGGSTIAFPGSPSNCGRPERVVATRLTSGRVKPPTSSSSTATTALRVRPVLVRSDVPYRTRRTDAHRGCSSTQGPRPTSAQRGYRPFVRARAHGIKICFRPDNPTATGVYLGVGFHSVPRGPLGQLDADPVAAVSLSTVPSTAIGSWAGLDAGLSERGADGVVVVPGDQSDL